MVDDRPVSSGYFDRLAHGWDGRYRRSPSFRERLQLALELVADEKPVGPVIDYGCGTGVMTRELARMGYHVLGIDASQQMVTAARHSLDVAGFGTTLVLHGNSPSVVRDAYKQVDGVLCLGVLEYVADDFLLIEGLAKMVRSEGFLLLSVPNRKSVLRRLESFAHEHPRLFDRFHYLDEVTSADGYLTYQEHQYDPKKLDGFMARLGFEGTYRRFLAAPKALGPLARSSYIGMTMMVKYRKLAAWRDG